jgi:hypothetical protein
MIFTKSATARIFGVSASRVVKVKMVNNAILVVLKGERPQFFSKKLWIADFAKQRQVAGLELANKVQRTEQPLVFLVEGTTDEYSVDLSEPGRPSCDCPDWQKQHEQWGRGCCKHCYGSIARVGALRKGLPSLSLFTEVLRANANLVTV